MSDEPEVDEPETEPEGKPEGKKASPRGPDDLRRMVEEVVRDILGKNGAPTAAVRTPTSPVAIEADWLQKTREAMKIIMAEDKEEEEKIKRIVAEQTKPPEPKPETAPDVRRGLQKILGW